MRIGLAVTSLIGILIVSIKFAFAQECTGYFEGDLILKDVAANYIETGPYDPGDTEFELVEDYSFVRCDGTKITVPKGSVVDGASIPQKLWSIIGAPWSGRYRNAAVIHDYISSEEFGYQYESKIAHLIFLEAMIAGGTSEKKYPLMYSAVMLAGDSWPVGGPIAVRGTVTANIKKQIILMKNVIERAKNNAVLNRLLSTRYLISIADNPQTLCNNSIISRMPICKQ